MKNIHSLDELNATSLVSANEYALPDWQNIVLSTAGASWALVDGDELYGFCSVWLEDVPVYKEFNCSALGYFFAVDADSGYEILHHAFEYLRNHGKDYVIGPMNGNTWQSYRFVVEESNHPRFFLEPDSVMFWKDIFSGSGFEIIAEYSSALSDKLEYEDSSVEKVRIRMERLGLVVRPFKLEQSESELEAVYHLSIKSFARNILYTDISKTEFMQLYQKVIPYVIPEYFQVVEDNGAMVAYVFAIPDYAQKIRGEKIDTLIVKTVTRDPARKYAGLGNYLVHYIHQVAIKNGFKKIIHALMHQSNVSRKISDRSALTIRRYALYGREL